MYGIAGFTFFQELNLDIQATIEKMTSTLIHRGPDEVGTYYDQHVALGSQRLSIIDLISGKMPIHNEDRTLWIVFNGEIYDFPELRAELVDKGHALTTQTDTEVILHLYEEYGTGCVTKLNGIFAFALWDARNFTLFLARDRLGIKPLQYYQYSGGLIFASELKALLQHPMVEARLHLDGLSKYLTFGYVPAPHSIFQGIQKLEPGHWLVHTRGKSDIRQYWDIPIHEGGIAAKRETE